MKAASICTSEVPTMSPENSLRTTLRFSVSPSCSRNGGSASVLTEKGPRAIGMTISTQGLAREAEAADGDLLAHDLHGAGGDGGGDAVPPVGLEDAVVEGGGRAGLDAGVGAHDFHGEVGVALVSHAGVHAGDGGVAGAGVVALGHDGGEPVGHHAGGAVADVGLGDLLPKDGVASRGGGAVV